MSNEKSAVLRSDNPGQARKLYYFKRNTTSMKRIAMAITTVLTATLALSSIARANEQIPSQLVGEWKTIGDIIDFHADSGFVRSTQASNLFSYCGISRTVASVGIFTLNGNRITVIPKDGFLSTDDSCTGRNLGRSHYVNPPGTYVAQLGNNGQTLVLTGPIGSKYSTSRVFRKSS